jgi:hypothetical protein
LANWLTGIEATSNGIPAFKRPLRKRRDDPDVMAAILTTLFLGITPSPTC